MVAAVKPTQFMDSRVIGQIDPARNPLMICIGQAGFESLMEGELAGAGSAASERGPGWVLAGRLDEPDLAFAHEILFDPVEVRGGSVNAMAAQALEHFIGPLRGERVEAAWPCWWQAPADVAGLGRRAASVAQAFSELLRRRMSRVARLASPELPWAVGPVRGLFVWLVDFDRAWVARTAWSGGARRMADDPAAPSRSYLKVEEAYGLLGSEPVAGETVADLGAAPGGWSYSAARRGARVLAIDNGPLKGGALGNPRIDHRRADAFGFRPAEGEVFDWLFCDLIEEPHHVLKRLAGPWLAGRWCRRFVINFKFGRTDPLALLRELRAADSPFSAHAEGVRIRHLYHDREEFTVVGRVPG